MFPVTAIQTGNYICTRFVPLFSATDDFNFQITQYEGVMLIQKVRIFVLFMTSCFQNPWGLQVEPA